MIREIQFFYDFRSPYSYLAYTQLLDMPVRIALRPMRVLDVMKAVGNVPTTIVCAVKGQYSRIDLRRWGKRYGIEINPSNMRENDGEACARAVLAAATPQDAATITLALYRASWSEGKSLVTHDDISAVIAAAGVDPAPVATRIDAPDVIARLDANTAEAVERGVFGSPTMFVGDAMFFGNDRIEFVRDELARLEESA